LQLLAVFVQYFKSVTKVIKNSTKYALDITADKLFTVFSAEIIGCNNLLI